MTDFTTPRAMTDLPASTGLRIVRSVLLGTVVVAFPLAAWLVVEGDADRNTTADLLAWIYSLGLFLAFSTAWWPLRSLRQWSTNARLRSTVILFTCVSYITHLTWELGWLVLHRAIADSPDALWSYPWWAYIDGGDARYAEAPPELIGMEILSVTNGIIGLTSLYFVLRSARGTRRWQLGLLGMMATAVVHLYSTSLYFLSEIADGLVNVDTSSFTDTYIKFGLANLPWLVFPPMVLWWAGGELLGESPLADADV